MTGWWRGNSFQKIMSLKSKLHLRETEEIIEIIRQSSVNRFGRYLFCLLFLLTNTFFTFWFWTKGTEGRIVYGLIWALGLYMLYATWFVDRANYMVITTERIFDVHRKSLFTETISSLEFLEIDDVVVERSGLFSTLFNYGFITIHPREGNFHFEISRVKRPEYVQNLLLEKRGSFVKENRFKNKQEVYKQFLKIIPELSEAELTLAYQKINNQLLLLADDPREKDEQMV